MNVTRDLDLWVSILVIGVMVSVIGTIMFAIVFAVVSNMVTCEGGQG